MTSAVADSGPLIHLHEIHRLNVLQVFESVHVPDAVWAECMQPGRVPERTLLELKGLNRYTLLADQTTSFVDQNNLSHLQLGEQTSLCLCKQLDLLVLLTDDLAAREAAKRLDLTPVGSLGIVVKAFQLGMIPLADARQSLEDLQDVSSLFVTRAVAEIAIEQLTAFSRK